MRATKVAKENTDQMADGPDISISWKARIIAFADHQITEETADEVSYAEWNAAIRSMLTDENPEFQQSVYDETVKPFGYRVFLSYMARLRRRVLTHAGGALTVSELDKKINTRFLSKWGGFFVNVGRGKSMRILDMRRKDLLEAAQNYNVRSVANGRMRDFLTALASELVSDDQRVRDAFLNREPEMDKLYLETAVPQ